MRSKSKKSRSRKGRRTMGSIPFKVRVPNDIPTIDRNRPFNEVVELTPSLTDKDITVDNIHAAIKRQLRLNNANYIIKKLMFWGPDEATVTGDGSISVSDGPSSRSFSDSRTFGKSRAKVAYAIPPTRQITYTLGNSSAAVIAFVTNIEHIHVHITIWA